MITQVSHFRLDKASPLPHAEGDERVDWGVKLEPLQNSCSRGKQKKLKRQFPEISSAT
jgi:hypothetical protein